MQQVSVQQSLANLQFVGASVHDSAQQSVDAISGKLSVLSTQASILNNIENFLNMSNGRIGVSLEKIQ